MWCISKKSCNFVPEIRIQTHMQTFVGNIDGRLDEKGRIFVPAIYRRIRITSV